MSEALPLPVSGANSASDDPELPVGDAVVSASEVSPDATTPDGTPNASPEERVPDGGGSAGDDSGGGDAGVRVSRGRGFLRVAFVVVALGFGGWAVVDQWAGVKAAVGDLGVWALVGGLLAVVAGLVASMQVWRSLLAAAGSPLPFLAAAGVFFVGQLGKYIPGSVWPIVAQMELAAAYRVPRRRAATAAVLTMLVSLCAGLIAAAVALPLLASGALAGYRWALLAAPLILACLHPRVVNPVLDRLLRLARRTPLEQPLTGRAVAVALGWALLSWVLLGLHVWVLAVRLGAPPGKVFALAVGGFAFAWSVGFLAVVAPAGAGVRDVLLVTALSGMMPTGRATAIALTSRILMTVGDLVLAGLAAARRRKVVLR